MNKNSVNIEFFVKNGYVETSKDVWERKKPSNKGLPQKKKIIAPAQQGIAKTGIYTFDVTPMGKPSFQKSDKWRTKDHSNPKMRQRPNVGRWIETKAKMMEEAKKQGFVMPESGADIRFWLPMPKSWSKKKKNEMDNKPHRQRPDLDNLMKFLGDSICEEDSYIFHYTISKWWHPTGKILITIP